MRLSDTESFSNCDNRVVTAADERSSGLSLGAKIVVPAFASGMVPSISVSVNDSREFGCKGFIHLRLRFEMVMSVSFGSLYFCLN